MSKLTESGYEPMLNEYSFIDAFDAVAEKKSKTSLVHLFTNACFAGMLISLAGYAYLVIKSFGGTPLLAGVGFCAGLVMVVILQADLFTSNVLLTVAGTAGRVRWSTVTKNLIIVYICNLIGSLFFVWLLVNSGVSESLQHTAHHVFEEKTGRTLGAFLARGFLCNFLVVMGYQLAMFSRDLTGKVYGILFPVALFVMCGFEHCVANMFLLPFGAIASGMEASVWVPAMVRNMVPVTIANILGGYAMLMLQPRFQKFVSKTKEK